MGFPHMIYQDIDGRADGILLAMSITEYACKLAIRRVALYEEALTQMKLEVLVHLALTSPIVYPPPGTLPNSPVLVGGDTQPHSTRRTSTVSSRCEARGERFVLYVLQVETVPAKERRGFDHGGCS